MLVHETRHDHRMYIEFENKDWIYFACRHCSKIDSLPNHHYAKKR